MSNETVIYISKRCPYCRDLLVKVQGRDDIKGTIRISSIDDEQFPSVIKTVPSMISEGVLYNADEIFRMLEESKTQGGKQPEQSEQASTSKDNEDSLYSGYCENGSCLSFSSLDGDTQSDREYMGQFAPLDHNPKSIDISDDGYNTKSSGIDNDYEKMMKERGDLSNNQQIR